MEIGIAAAAGTVAVIAVAWPTLFWYGVRTLEKPKYTVIRALAPASFPKRTWLATGIAAMFSSHTMRGVPELRLYAPTLVAEVEVNVEGGTMKDAMSQGFRQVAGFIFGKNKAVGGDASEKVAMTSPVVAELPKAEKVAMTSPVVAEMGGNGKYKISFVMPSKYTAESLPRPDNPNVLIREVPGRQLAAMGFSGKMPPMAMMQRVNSYQAKLEQAIELEGLKVIGPPTLLQYHPPFAPYFVRHNEVVLPVE
eukprot:gene20529-27319_t